MSRQKKSYDDGELSIILKFISRKLRIFREELGISQNELSRRSKVALSTINEIENEVVRDLRLSTITCLARHLDRKPIEFITDSDLNLTDPDLKDLERTAYLLNRILKKVR